MPIHPPSDAAVHVQLLPDWTAGRRALARFDVLLKVASGQRLAVPAQMEVIMLDSLGQVLRTVSVPLASREPRQGPGWQWLRAGVTEVGRDVEQAACVVAGRRTQPVERREATRPVALVPVFAQVGLPGEPHLFWRFYNHRAVALPAAAVLGDRVLWLDGRRYRLLDAAYDGPALLPPGRALSGLLSLDDIDPAARRGLHTLCLDVLDESSGGVVNRWC